MEKKEKRQRKAYNGGRVRFAPKTMEIIEYLTKNWVTKDEFKERFGLGDRTTPASYCSYICKHSTDEYRTKLRHTICKGQLVESAWRLSVKGDALWNAPQLRKMQVLEFQQRIKVEVKQTTQAERDEIVRRINAGEDMRRETLQDSWKAATKRQMTDEEQNMDKRQGLDSVYIKMSNGTRRVDS